MLGNPPAVHPLGPPETPALPQSKSVLKTSHVCTGGTVLQEQNYRNRKLMPGCAQTVEDRNSLWKAPEKRKEILGHGFSRINTDQSWGFAERKKGIAEAMPFEIRANPCK